MDIKDIKGSVWKLVISSDINFDHIDLQELTKFIAVMYSKNNLRKHQVISTVPIRQVDIDGTNRRPVTIAYLDSDTCDRTVNGQTEKNVQKWS